MQAMVIPWAIHVQTAEGMRRIGLEVGDAGQLLQEDDEFWAVELP